MLDLDGFEAYSAEANRFAHTVVYGLPEESYYQRNRRDTSPRKTVVTQVIKAMTKVAIKVVTVL